MSLPLFRSLVLALSLANVRFPLEGEAPGTFYPLEAEAAAERTLASWRPDTPWWLCGGFYALSLSLSPSPPLSVGLAFSLSLSNTEKHKTQTAEEKAMPSRQAEWRAR